MDDDQNFKLKIGGTEVAKRNPVGIAKFETSTTHKESGRQPPGGRVTCSRASRSASLSGRAPAREKRANLLGTV